MANDQAKREIIPSRADLKTKYHPCNDLLMIIPLPDITRHGSIILPESSTITLNEGHVVEKGPKAGDQFNVGDFVTWDTNSEYRMTVDDDVHFILVRPSCITMMIPHRELLPSDPNQAKLPFDAPESSWDGDPKKDPYKTPEQMPEEKMMGFPGEHLPQV